MNTTSSVITPEALATFVPMNVLSDEHLKQLLEYATVVELAPGESFDANAADADYTYYLSDGVFELLEGERVIETMSAGEDDARFAINRLRSERIYGRASGPVKLLRVDISLVSTLLIWMQSLAGEGSRGLSPEDSAGWVPRLLGSELFARIPPANIQRIFDHLESIDTKVEEVVIKQGDPGDYYYIVRRGNCAVTREVEPGATPVLLASLGPGDSFGEEALLSNARRNATITMVSDGELMRLTQDDFRSLITRPLVNTISASEAAQIIESSGSWVDVRLAEEHKHDGVTNSLNLPLEKLRGMADQLDKDKPYVVYSDSDRRAPAGAFLLSEMGYTAYVLDGGLRANPDLSKLTPASSPATSPLPKSEAGLIDLSEVLAKADQEVEVAFQDKLEATTMRRLWLDELAQAEDADKETNAKLQAKQKRLELESHTASAALAEAQRKKLEVETRLRSSEALAERRRAEAEVACENLRKRAESLLKDEETRLQDQYAVAAAKLNDLKRTREETEERLRKERERIENELSESQTLQLEAKKIKTDLERMKLEAEKKADQIRSKEASQEKSLRSETEAALRAERQKLEIQFALSVSELEKAEQKLDKAEAAKLVADGEAKRIVASMRAAEDKRREEAEAHRLDEQRKLAVEAEKAEESVADAQKAKETAETTRRTAMQKLARIRAASGEGDEPQELDPTNVLRQEIERIDANVSDAAGRLDAAQRAKDSAEANRIAGEEKAAKQRESEQEIRMTLHEEAEEWLKEEQARSQAELDKAKQELAQKWALRESTEQKRRELEDASVNLLDDISAQLTSPDEALEAVGEKAYAEEKTELAVAAQEDLAQKKVETQAALKDARAQIERLRRQGLLD